jgi:hypothetical protein
MFWSIKKIYPEEKFEPCSKNSLSNVNIIGFTVLAQNVKYLAKSWRHGGLAWIGRKRLLCLLNWLLRVWFRRALLLLKRESPIVFS